MQESEISQTDKMLMASPSRKQALCVSDGSVKDFYGMRHCGVSLEGFSTEYLRGDSLESFSGVCL